jgi:hypothetical protein
MPHLEGSEKLVKAFENEWQDTYDDAGADAAKLKSVSNVVERSAVKLKPSETHHSSKHKI